MPKYAESAEHRDEYRWQTLRPLNCLVFVLPLLLIFHFGTAWFGTELLALQHIDKILHYFGGTTVYLPALLIIAVLLFQHVAKSDRWKIDPSAVAGIVGESIIWMLPLIGLGMLYGRISAQAAAAHPAPSKFTQEILLGIGAGIYEEFLFRMLFISLVMLFLSDVFGLKKDVTAILGVICGAVLFSMYHFVGQWPDSFPWTKFLYYSVAGVYLGTLYVFRGFGIAVGAHTAYNLYWAIRHLI